MNIIEFVLALGSLFCGVGIGTVYGMHRENRRVLRVLADPLIFPPKHVVPLQLFDQDAS